MDPPTETPTSTPDPTDTSTTTTTTSSSTETTSSSTSETTSDTTSSSTSSDTTSLSSTTDSTTSESSSESSTTTSSSSPSLTSTTSSVVTTDPQGGTTTLETVVTVTPSPSATPSSDNSNSDSGFFANKGAVAGVFTVVGIIALVLAIVLVTGFIRRRRRKQFDRDVDEAAREAAGTQPPIFLDDPDDNYHNTPAFTGYSDPNSQYTGYSDTTHGTFAQPPMMDQYQGDSYGMHNLPAQQPYDTYAGIGAGAAGVGIARARSQRAADGDNGMAGFGAGGLHAGHGEQTSPYPAFVAPDNNGHYSGYYPSDTQYPAHSSDPYHAFAGPDHPNLNRQKSQNNTVLSDTATSAAASTQHTYADRYQPGYKGEAQLPPAANTTAAYGGKAPSIYEEDAYGGYSSHGHGSPGAPGDRTNQEDYINSPSPADSDNEEDIPRVLKVANS